jgi:hypothetical protein
VSRRLDAQTGRIGGVYIVSASSLTAGPPWAAVAVDAIHWIPRVGGSSPPRQ